MTVKNENLFSMMKQSAEREQKDSQQARPALSLNKIMGGLQTYKDKQSKRDPTVRVNIPYYHKVISRARGRHKQTLSVPTNPNSAIMLSKQLPLLERKKKSAALEAPDQCVLEVHGEHHCGRQCFEDNLSDAALSKFETAKPSSLAASKKLDSVLAGKRQRDKLKKIYAARLSQQAQVPKTTDLNKQSEFMLPQISVTNKRITEVTIPAKTRRR